MDDFFNKEKIKRFFAFGCSFTRYGWMTWPCVIAVEFQVPYYNYGAPGGGNQYIFNTIMQADALYKFDENDLIMVSWTNVCREDRYIKDKWICPGNIYTQNVYPTEWVEKFVDPAGMAMRDFATIYAVDNFLKSKKCQYYFLSMIDITTIFNQYNYDLLNTLENKDTIPSLISLYDNSLSKIRSNFYDVLWAGKIENKMNKIWKQFNYQFSDCHPSPIEHYTYLNTVLKYDFSDNTINKVKEAQDIWEQILTEWANNPSHSPEYPHKELYMFTHISSEYEIEPNGWLHDR